MKTAVDLRRRVGKLIELLKDIPEKHRTPAMARLLADLQSAAAQFDGAGT
jgi:hypothetical protein